MAAKKKNEETALPQTYETTDRDESAISGILDRIKSLLTDSATGWSAVSQMRTRLIDAVAVEVYGLRGQFRRRIRTTDGMVILADWQGKSPEYREAWSKTIKPILTEHTTTPEADTGMDSDYTAFQNAVNYRVSKMVAKDHPADVAFLEGVKNGNNSATAPQPTLAAVPAVLAEGESAESVFAPVEVPASVQKGGAVKLAELILANAQRLSTLIDQAEAFTPEDKQAIRVACVKTALILAAKPGDEGGYEGIVSRVAKVAEPQPVEPVEAAA